MTNHEYWKEIKDIAETICVEALEATNQDREAAEEEINDYRLHEWIDGHQWVIYNAYHLEVMQHSENTDYFTDNFGEAGHYLQEGGIDRLHQVIAFWAMYADVQDQICDELDELCEEEE